MISVGVTSRSNIVGTAFVLLLCLPYSLSCILLLNGWTPLSVSERTALADIVTSAEVLHAYKDDRTEARTYTATVKLLTVFKGREILSRIMTTGNNDMVYNISNFGDKKMCYADVDDGQRYILFLTEYRNRLSAKYDDIFGATARFTLPNEEEITLQLGWEDWGVWGPCSRSCDFGIQVRQRTCRKENSTCEGRSMEQRRCNTFPCKGIRDLIRVFQIQSLPLGVSRDSSRPTVFNISGVANLNAPLSAVTSAFPSDFSIMATVRLPVESEGFLFTISDIMGIQRLAIKYGKKTSLEYYDQNNLPGFKSPKFDVSIADGEWHQVAFGVKGQQIQMMLDCKLVQSKAFLRSLQPDLGSNLVAALGPYFARFGQPFQGQLEQLVLIVDPDAASQQCHDKVIDAHMRDQAVQDEASMLHNPSPLTSLTTQQPIKHSNATDNPALTATQWSDWSPCSVTCGNGQQTRNLYCINNAISVDDCSTPGTQTQEIRDCQNPSCHECRHRCKNGGECRHGKCACPNGYAGNRCQKAMCDPSCMNGGRCTAPNVCNCTEGYMGQNCDEPICESPCENGGRCIAPGVCSCPYGLMSPQCAASCSMPCHNGGRCVRHDTCKCRKGYRGVDCSEPICRKGCYNGGRCVAPNKCACPQGYTGKKCNKPVCEPACQNRGVCVYPYVCKCKRGYYGAFCEQFACRRTCKNGGKCIGHNKCQCQDGFSGKWCQKGTCSKPCLNGGKCRKRGCRCPVGFSGEQCERKGCKYEKYVVPYQKTFKKPQRDEYLAPCGPWKWRECVKTRLRYITVTKVLYRTLYRCV